MALRATLAACALESGRRRVSLGVHPAQLLQRLLVGELLLDVRRYPLGLRPVQRLERRRWRVDRIDRRAAVKHGAPVEDCDFIIGAANLLPQIERTRFVKAFEAIADASGAKEANMGPVKDLFRD